MSHDVFHISLASEHYDDFFLYVGGYIKAQELLLSSAWF